MIEESKILEFIKKNDKRVGSVLNKYDSLIERLLKEEIKLNAIYEFIFENDNTIGNKANFYKYCKRFQATSKKREKPITPKIENKKEETQNIQKVSHTTQIKSSNATSILSQDFNLLD